MLTKPNSFKVNMRQLVFIPFFCTLLFPLLSLSALSVEVMTGFSPGGSAQSLVLDAINDAEYSIDLAADRSNAENVVFLRNSPAAADAYTKEFNRLWAEGYPLNNRYPASKKEGKVK